MFVTLDSSVIIAALRRQEEKHSQCRLLLEKVKDAQYTSIQPYTVLVEVAAAIKRRTNSESLAIEVKNLLQSMDTMNFVELGTLRADSAAEVAAKTGLRGMDAVVVQVAQEFDATLVTLDLEMIDKAEHIVNVRGAEEF
ncbi:type II toxin-antitoxin system VapC family toxin [Candidatus Poribacteria bacterium]